MAYTREELLVMGFDAETADMMLKSNSNTGGASAPFKKLSMNYSDIIADEAGVKKGNFIAGFQEDKKTLTIKETGVDFGDTIEFFIVNSTVFQVSHFDTATNTNVFQTNFFFSAYETKTQTDKKTGMTVDEWKSAGRKATFNNILLLMVKTEDGWAPYTHYLHGTNYNKWFAQLEERGVKNPGFDTLFKVKSLKVATSFQPAWCFDIQDTQKRTPDDIMGSIKVVSEAIKKFNTWVETSNKTSTNNSTSVQPTSSPTVDVEEDDIQF